jgi:hypothetical protein
MEAQPADAKKQKEKRKLQQDNKNRVNRLARDGDINLADGGRFGEKADGGDNQVFWQQFFEKILIHLVGFLDRVIIGHDFQVVHFGVGPDEDPAGAQVQDIQLAVRPFGVLEMEDIVSACFLTRRLVDQALARVGIKQGQQTGQGENNAQGNHQLHIALHSSPRKFTKKATPSSWIVNEICRDFNRPRRTFRGNY